MNPIVSVHTGQDSGVTPPSERVRVRRRPERARYDTELVHQVLDESLICHVGFVFDDQPYVLPTIHARHGETLYLHGATSNHMLKVLSSGAPLCITTTIVDGLVLARSAFHHTMNYRSVVVLGTGYAVDDPEERDAAFRRLVDHIAPGRWPHLRPPTEKELRATRLVRVPLEECSAKVRSGPPVDDEADYELPIWSGELPLAVAASAPLPASGLPVPAHVMA